MHYLKKYINHLEKKMFIHVQKPTHLTFTTLSQTKQSLNKITHQPLYCITCYNHIHDNNRLKMEQ